MMDSIRISDLKVDCVIGILPHEREQAQPLVVDIDLNLDLSEAARSTNITHTIDYALVAQQVKFILKESKFELLESAALAIASWLAAPVPTAHLYCVESVQVRIRKPLALEGNGIPEIRIKRHNRDIKIESMRFADVNQDVLFCSQRTAVIRVYQFGSSEIPAAPAPFNHYKDFATGSKDILRIAWVK